MGTIFNHWSFLFNNNFVLFIPREKPEDKEWLEFRAQKLPLLLNFAQCKLSQKDYYAVIEHTSEVIEADHGTLIDLLS